jgi:SAM-dependent methyltransferase
VYKTLLNIYIKQQFFPDWRGIFLNPFYFARRNLWLAIIKYADALTGNLLDVGCGSKPYADLFKNISTYTGLDIDSVHSRKRAMADFFYDGTSFPFKDDEFDSILCNQVLEHVFNPDQFISEIARVLKPGGRLLLTVPFIWDEHEQPFDYARYTSFGLTALVQKQGLVVLKHEKLGADASNQAQLVNAYLYKITKKLPTKLHLLLIATVMASVNLIGLIACKVLPKNPDLFLDHVVIARKQNESLS